MLNAPLSREHLSLIGGITPEGRLFQQALDHALKGADVVRFLRHLVRHLGRVLVIWDGLPAHRSKEVKRYLSEEAQGQVWLERLPGYAPDLNPKEGVWKHLKLVELKNLCCKNLAELKAVYRRAKERLRHKRETIRACFQMVGMT
jgi:transposase